jgi:type IV secretion system protein VirB9
MIRVKQGWISAAPVVGVSSLLLGTGVVVAQTDPPPPPPPSSLPATNAYVPPTTVQTQVDPEAYFSRRTKPLSEEDRTALEAGAKAQSNYVLPVAGPDGAVRFHFRGQAVSVVCAVLQVCDIELEPGESVKNLNIGDPRFTVEPAISGSGASEIQHLVLKPLDVGIDTSLMVTTDRRTYYFRLKSDRRAYMPRVGFTYSDSAPNAWVPPLPPPPTPAELAKSAAAAQAAAVPPEPQPLFFNYEVDGHADWRPIRVYSDGVHTFIQMPSTMSQTEAPTLLVIRDHKEQVIVNYRVQGDRYIVDSVFKKAILIAGVGRHQTRVTITRDGDVG